MPRTKTRGSAVRRYGTKARATVKKVIRRLKRARVSSKSTRARARTRH